MFYVFNVQQWLEEVVSASFEKHLDPEKSVFALMLFSSLDFDFVTFFRDRRPQISQYTGENVHIFTPMIFDGDVVPDGEWREIKDGFSRAGIPLSNRPSVILFHLRKRKATGYDPHYFAAFELPIFRRFEESLRDFVDACIRYGRDETRLARELGTLFRAQNLVHHVGRETPLSGWPISDVLHAPRVFISYSHGDKERVLELYSRLKAGRLKLWLDQYELTPGAQFQKEIEIALQNTDAVMMILSKNAANSKWLPFEGSLFYSKNDQGLIIPVVLDSEGKTLARELPFLKDRLYVDLSDPQTRQENLEKLSSLFADLKRG